MENLNKNAINNGVIIAIISIAIQVIMYYAMPSLFGSFATGIGIWAILLIIYVLLTIDLRKKIGGFWLFKDALKGIFLMSFIANAGSAIFTFIFYKFIEPNAYDKIVGFVTEGLTATYEKMGMSQDKVDEAITQVEKSLKTQFQPDILDFLKSLGIAILVGFVMSLIFAAIFKKSPPMFAPAEEVES
ncbi:MAG: DUF4199 domain-containing protein [Bacteroidetes bacterium]|nr:DUF4199 domain-containing protein [Pseudopedobacter sp.]MBU1373347.1 DUF4199 domain-containing protein [Bacteroidota bacterium]MBU1484438.1 DUF4199 domain-containing protein [Bacteroidota bacterium]MBU2268996.1 DUF4199 domain-containing protein [Bacteroidota bacterium]MBU2376399.1 DUF4199 domain-containing protein [Bacteroidota bacterium]